MSKYKPKYCEILNNEKQQYRPLSHIIIVISIITYYTYLLREIKNSNLPP